LKKLLVILMVLCMVLSMAFLTAACDDHDNPCVEAECCDVHITDDCHCHSRCGTNGCKCHGAH